MHVSSKLVLGGKAGLLCPVPSLSGVLGENRVSPRPCLEPTSPSGPGANPHPPPLGLEADPGGRARAQAAKPEGMFGRQSADAALGREQTEAVCLGVICSFSEEPHPGAPEQAERRQGGQGSGAQAGGLSRGPQGGTPSSAPPPV